MKNLERPMRGPTACPGRELADFTRIRHALRSGRLVDDRVFDDIYPLSIRRASSVHWTPVEVAVSVAKLLAPKPGAVVLDVGAGVGKFCIAAAASVDAVVKGVEHRPHFVEVGRAAAAKVGVDIHLVRGTLADVDPAGVDGIYLLTRSRRTSARAATISTTPWSSARRASGATWATRSSSSPGHDRGRVS